MISNSKESNNKKQQTCFSHFGVTHQSKSSKIKQKKKETCKAHYNVEYSFQAKEVKEQSKQTKYIRYGDENYTNRGKATLTYQERYGYINPFQVPQFKEKSIQTIQKLYHVDNISQFHITNYDIYSNDELFKNFIIDQYNQKKMFLTLSDIYSYFNISSNCLKHKLEKLNLLDYFYIQESQLEIDFKTFLDSYNIQYQRRNRSILTNNVTNSYYKIDFLVNNIGIEINDIGTHNSFTDDRRFSKDSLYHQSKSLSAIEKNIRLIHIWEWELRVNSIWNRISKWLLNEFNHFKHSIDINQCKLVQINKELEKYFYSLYSIKDYQESDICLGLMYNNQLYQVMSFKNINDKDWQLLNYCTAYNYSIDNGYNIKLLILLYLVLVVIGLSIFYEISLLEVEVLHLTTLTVGERDRSTLTHIGVAHPLQQLSVAIII